MRVSTSRLPLVLRSAATAIVARTEAVNAQATPIIVPPSDAGAPVESPSAAALAPPTPTTPPSRSVESPALPAPLPSRVPLIHIGARLRAAGRYYSVRSGSNASVVDSTYGELRASGKLHEYVSVTLSLYAGAANGPVGIEDAYIGFDFADPVHLWVGQMLVPADRANLGGPFYAIPWNFYPGVLAYGATTHVVAVPRENSIGRDGGAVLWGDLAGNKSHYAFGAFLPSTPLPGSASPNAQAMPKTPMLSSRLGVDILGHESGYSVKSTYFGNQDIVALGVGGQFQKESSVGVAPSNAMGGPAPTQRVGDYADFNSDALVEIKYGDGGFLTIEGDYHYYFGNNEAVRNEVSVLGAVATPKLAIGNLQPYGRWQSFSTRANSGALNAFAVDAGLNYLVEGPALRVMFAYEHVDLGNDERSDAWQLGAQAILF